MVRAILFAVTQLLQVRFTYNNGIQRNDHSIVHYGFMQDLETPLLACIDRPNGDLADDSMCPDDDSDYGMICSRPRAA